MDTQVNQTPNQEDPKTPDYRLSLVRETPQGDQWASTGVGWFHKDGEGITFTPDLLKIFGLKLVARKITDK